jgi:hypothetical protein
MGFLTPTKPVITQREAKEIDNRLYNQHNMNAKKRAVVQKLLEPHLKDADRYGDPAGVSPSEADEIKQQLEGKDMPSIYGVEFTEPEKEAIEKLFDDYEKLNR